MKSKFPSTYISLVFFYFVLFLRFISAYFISKVTFCILINNRVITKINLHFILISLCLTLRIYDSQKVFIHNITEFKAVYFYTGRDACFQEN